MDSDPLTALLPDQSPEALQDVAFVDDQLSVELPPLAIALGPKLKLTIGAKEEGATVTVVDCVALPPTPVHVRT